MPVQNFNTYIQAIFPKNMMVSLICNLSLFDFMFENISIFVKFQRAKNYSFLYSSISASISSKIQLRKFRGKGICYICQKPFNSMPFSCLVDKIGICYHMLLILDVTRIERDLPQMICF